MNQNNNTCNGTQDQENAVCWADQIRASFSGDFEESAKTTGALIRKREFKSAYDLLKLLLLFAVTSKSLRILSVAAMSLKIADLTDTALRKRIIKSVTWLTLILSTMLPTRALKQGNGHEPFLSLGVLHLLLRTHKNHT